ncbi:flagellar motor switch protein FliG [Benzoatithermus flavus]|uniref:Flagellar motor switch protein FliG n=1 Tax=Benzoatithermus flavus TaxID=3108223 RepID=A0ABU8XUV4_9PROT
MARINAITTRLNGVTGPEKVAIVMLAVGKTHAAKLLERFDEDEQKEIVRAMMTMGLVSGDMVERLLATFVSRIQSSDVFGSVAQAEQILLSVLPPERVRTLMEELKGAAGCSIWEKLQSVPDAQVAAFLAAESPQTAAFVLTRLPPAQAARVLQQLPRPLAEDIVKRILNLTPVAKPVVDDVERVLRTEFLINIGQNRMADNHGLLAEIFNHLDHELESAMFASLDKDMPESSERVRSLMFTFADLKNIDDAGIQILMQELPPGLLPLALKGAAPEMMDLFLRNMAERAARMLREEINGMPKVRLRDVEDARRQIVNICKELIARGEITASGEDDGGWVG